MSETGVLRIENLKKYFPVKKGFFNRNALFIRAVDGVSLSVGESETLGLVGESGCGKSTLGRVVLGLYPPTEGGVYFRDSPNLGRLKSSALLPYRRRIQMIFQDPVSSLNPRMTVGEIVGEALTIHKLARGKEKKERIAELLESVGLSPKHASRFPHEFSGGQRQRIGVARALAVSPEVIIADEPVSALDVSIQAQIVNLLKKLQDERGISFVFISHDLSVVGHISRRVAVMYLGRIMELGPKGKVFENPAHPYTRALMEAVPRIDPRSRRRRIVLEGDPPSPMSPPSGCPFHPRCPSRFEPCDKMTPPLLDVSPEQKAACLLYHPDWKDKSR